MECELKHENLHCQNLCIHNSDFHDKTVSAVASAVLLYSNPPVRRTCVYLSVLLTVI
jgi:hypothetical protein